MATDTKLGTESNILIAQLGSGAGASPFTDDIDTTDFNFGGKSPITYLQFLIGQDIHGLFGDSMLNEAFEKAFQEIADLIVDDIIFENLGDSASMFTVDNTSGETSWSSKGFTYGKRILRVYRTIKDNEEVLNDPDNTDQLYECRRINYALGKNLNPNSIYYENDPFSPTWYINKNGGVNILPMVNTAEPSGFIYYMSYPKFGIGTEVDTYQTHDLGQLSGWHNFSLIGAENEKEIFHGIPVQARNAVYLGAAFHLCSGYLSDHVQDDEDDELVQLLTKQMEVIGLKREVELKMIIATFGTGGSK